MQDPITLYVIRSNRGVHVGDSGVLEMIGVSEDDILSVPGLEKHTITLKEPLTDLMQREVDRAVQANPNNKRRALVGAYVAGWTFSQSPTPEGFDQLHPNISCYVAEAIQKAVFPSLEANPDFFTLVVKKLQEKQAKPSDSGKG